MKPFIVSCFWLDIKDETFYAYTAEAVLKHLEHVHEIKFYSVDFDAAEPTDAEDYDLWQGYFEGQRWSNGDWNPEILTVRSLLPEDAALPC